MKNTSKTMFVYIIIFVIIIGSMAVYMSADSTTDIEYNDLTYYDVYNHFLNEEVEKGQLNDTFVLILKLKNDKLIKYQLDEKSFNSFENEIMPLITEQMKNKVITNFDFVPPITWPAWLSFMPFVAVILVLIFLWWMFVSKTAGKGDKKDSGGFGGLGGKMNNFSKARTKLGTDEKIKILFKDVAGNDEEKEELQEVVDFLKTPEKYSALGARIPKGVLLVGAPGTGKTLLAKAVAGEAGVPFYSISGSDFVEMYVGVGASRVRDLFDTAKKTAPCIIFIDEIDAVGRHRGAGWGGGHDEREQTLNQLLVEMDGFGANDGVIVLAATNRPDILDPALLRPGRFDRRITINYPDIKGRIGILKIYARKKPLEGSVDLESIARATVGFTGADLENLMNEAALHAARKSKKLIGMEDIEEANIKILVGPQKRSMVRSEEEKRKTAYHEAGHAIVQRYCKTQSPVVQISIIPSGKALGYTLTPPTEDKQSVYRSELIEQIACLLGGRVAERKVFVDYSGGASSDIQRASDIARRMVTQLGMSDKLGPIVFGTGHDEVFLGRDYSTSKNYSEKTAAIIDEEINLIINEGNKIAEKIIDENRLKIDFISEFLMAREIMDQDQFELVFAENPTIELLDNIREEKRAKSKLENEEKKRKNDELELKKAKETKEKANENNNIPPLK